nr:hypothetical protein [uncultured bacterium]
MRTSYTPPFLVISLENLSITYFKPEHLVTIHYSPLVVHTQIILLLLRRRVN